MCTCAHACTTAKTRVRNFLVYDVEQRSLCYHERQVCQTTTLDISTRQFLHKTGDQFVWNGRARMYAVYNKAAYMNTCTRSLRQALKLLNRNSIYTITNLVLSLPLLGNNEYKVCVFKGLVEMTQFF